MQGFRKIYGRYRPLNYPQVGGAGTNGNPLLDGDPFAVWLPESVNQPDGTTVSTIIDSSGNGRDMTQSDSARRPFYISSALGGRPVIVFDGVNDLLVTSPWDRIKDHTVVFSAVALSGGMNPEPSIFSGSTPFRTRCYVEQSNPDQCTFVPVNNEAPRITLQTSLGVNAFFGVMKYFTEGGQEKVRVKIATSEWVEEVLSQTTGGYFCDYLSLGNWNFNPSRTLSGFIGQCAIYDYALSDEESDIRIDYLRNYYGL